MVIASLMAVVFHRQVKKFGRESQYQSGDGRIGDTDPVPGFRTVQ